jgi:hypothetical protein
MLGDGSVGRAFSACEGCAGLFLQDGHAWWWLQGEVRAEGSLTARQ